MVDRCLQAEDLYENVLWSLEWIGSKYLIHELHSLNLESSVKNYNYRQSNNRPDGINNTVPLVFRCCDYLRIVDHPRPHRPNGRTLHLSGHLRCDPTQD